MRIAPSDNTFISQEKESQTRIWLRFHPCPRALYLLVPAGILSILGQPSLLGDELRRIWGGDRVSGDNPGQGSRRHSFRAEVSRKTMERGFTQQELESLLADPEVY